MIGLLLPCRVVVRADGDERSLVQALDPRVMIDVPEREELRPVAEEAGKAYPRRSGQPDRALRLSRSPVRDMRGQEIAAACGQLAAEEN